MLPAAHRHRGLPAPVTLFDGDHLQLVHMPGTAPLTLLTFDIMHARANGRNAFAKKLCARNGFTLLGIVPKHPCWYPEAEIAQIAQICRSLRRGSTIAYGASMGGYGALRWGRHLGADHALACSPQATIDPAVTGDRDRRYHAYFQPVLHADMAVRDQHMPPGSVALYDPHFRPDRFQAGLLADMPNLSLIALPHMAHGTASCLAGSTNARAVFDHLMAAETQALRRRALRQRKGSDTYRLELAATALRHNRPDLAQRLARMAQDGNPIGYHMLMARRDMALAQPMGARAHYERVLDLQPTHRIAGMRLAQLDATLARQARVA